MLFMSQRNALIHIDRLEGREYPPVNVELGGKQSTLEGIYGDAGVTVEINKGKTDIPDLKGPNSSYSQAELDHIMAQYRKEPKGEEKMFAWLVIVTRYSDNDSVLGIMFDAGERKGTAVFQEQQMIRTDPRAYLRTSAHELGHQFNLHHEDGETYEENGTTKYTIMNQTWRIQPWPAAIGFKFGKHESSHLVTHPIEDVRPGGGGFYVCDSEHSKWHAGITVR
jgi:hypothetical protein